MPIDMSRLNVQNFSYFAFHPKAAALSERDKRIVILSHILLSLTCGLGHLITAIIYKCHKRDFKLELAKLAPAANLCPKIPKCERILVISSHMVNTPEMFYGCLFFFDNETTEKREISEEKLKKIIQENKVFIEDLGCLLDDVPLNIREGSRVYRFPLPKIAALDFPKIDYITVTGIEERIPHAYSCKAIKKNGQEERVILEIAEFEEIKRLHLAHIENPYRYSDNPLVNEIKQLTGLDLSIIEKIKVTGTMHVYPVRHSCDITFSNGKTKSWNLENEQLKKIRETNLVQIDK